MKSVALANGTFADAERHLLQSVASALEADVDVDALPPCTPEDTVPVFSDPLHRERLVQALIVTALIDGEGSADEIALIERYAAALDVKEPRVKYLHRLLDGQIGLLRLDIIRRSPLPRKLMRQTYEDLGLWGTIKMIKGFATGSLEPDPELAWRYKKLGLLPEGTFGREFWKHMTERGFAFPGEPGGIPPNGAHHDLTHVLAGYDTDAEGETQIAAFYAGYFEEDPFSFLFMVLAMFHLGVKVAPQPNFVATTGQFDPEKILRAMRRGSQINIDLTERWNHWEVMHLPIDEVRRMYNVLPA